jgi:glycosyltransferase involved in cell wall biosynthesis
MKKNQPIVTIITVTYNLIKNERKDFFIQMANSVKNQTYKNIEHLVIDGGSNDGTVDLIKKLGLKYISEKDSGIYDAMNKGGKLAKGDYITFLNSDDFFNDNTGIERSVKHIKKGYDFSFAPLYCINEGKPGGLLTKIKIRHLLSRMPLPHPGLLVKTSIFKKLGGFDSSFKLAADYDFVMKLYFENYRGVNIKKHFVTFREGGTSLDCSNTLKKEMPRVYFLRYGKKYNLTQEDCDKIFKTRKFPYKLLFNILFNEKNFFVRRSTWSMLIKNLSKWDILLKTKMKEKSKLAIYQTS